MKIGAQLYTVRDFTKNLTDFSETLKKVADIGYTSVQVSGACPYEPEWLAEQLKETGLTCDLTHFDYGRIINEPEMVVTEHKVYGCKYIGLGAMPGIFDENANRDTIQKFIDEALPAAKRITAAGGYFMYHNHHKEFFEYDGKICMDMLMEAFSPDEMGVTLDSCWVDVGGHDTVEWLKKLRGRTPCVHFKDYVNNANGDIVLTPIGAGKLNFEAIIRTCLDLGVEYAFVEHDNCNGEDPFSYLKEDYKYLTAQGLK